MNSSRPSITNGACRLLQDALGDHRRLVRVADVVEQQRELVAAQPRDGVVGAQRRFEPSRDRLQQLVADGVPEAVVDDLEAVEVEEQHRRAALGVVALGAPDRLVEAVDEQHAVREAGERVVQRVVLQAALGLAAVGDVGGGADDRASRGRCSSRTAVAAREHPAVARRRGAGRGARTRTGRRRRRSGIASSACVSGARSSGWTRPSHSPRVSPISISR